jgi:hypothetical protein
LSAQAAGVSLRPALTKERAVIRKSTLLTATLAMAASLTVASAQARDVNWSIGINAPLQPGVSIGTVISNAPVYQAMPVYQAAPVVYAEPVYLPAPVVYLPQPVYAPQRVIYAPRRVVYAPAWVPRGHDQRHWRQEYRHRGEPVMVGYGR